MKNGFLLTVSDESGSQPTQNCSWPFSSDISVIFLAADILSHSLVFFCRCNNKKHLTAKINTIKSKKEYGGDGGRNEEEIISPSKRLLCAALTHHKTISSFP